MSMTERLTEMQNEAARTGWTSSTEPASMFQIEWAIKDLGWEQVAIRPGEPAVTNLRPTTPENAPPRSLSAIYGLGPQPLHTDGAHLRQTPDLIILFAEVPNTTPTMLWRPQNRPRWLVDAVFVVDTGSESFLATAYDNDTARLRYDPGCMRAGNQRARDAVKYFADSQSSASTHPWTTAGQFLLIDNRRALHARAAVQDGDEDRTLTRISYRIGNTR